MDVDLREIIRVDPRSARIDKLGTLVLFSAFVEVFCFMLRITLWRRHVAGSRRAVDRFAELIFKIESRQIRPHGKLAETVAIHNAPQDCRGYVRVLLCASCSQVILGSCYQSFQFTSDLNRIKTINRKVTDLRGTAKEIGKEATSLRDEVREALIALEDSIRLADATAK